MTGTLQYEQFTKGIRDNLTGIFYPLHPASEQYAKGKIGLTVHYKLSGNDFRSNPKAKIYEKTPTYGRKNSARKVKQ